MSRGDLTGLTATGATAVTALSLLLGSVPALGEVSADGKWECGHDYNLGHYVCRVRELCDPDKDAMCRKQQEDQISTAFWGGGNAAKAKQDAVHERGVQRVLMQSVGCWRDEFTAELKAVITPPRPVYGLGAGYIPQENPGQEQLEHEFFLCQEKATGQVPNGMQIECREPVDEIALCHLAPKPPEKSKKPPKKPSR